MAYDAFETSVESGRPVELYIFTIGGVATRYTSAEDTVTYSGADYLPRAIDRNSPQVKSDGGGRQQMEITLPSDDPIASRYIGIVPADRVHVQILRFHRGDSPNGLILWDGRVVSCKFSQQGAKATLFSVSSESALSRPIPGRKYQSLCNHTLYDGLCQVAKSGANQLTGACTDVTGDTVTVTGLGLKGDDWARGGIIETANGDQRLIIDHTGDVVTLQLAFRDSPLGQSVDVYAGCDHSADTCASKFSNVINFGGFPHVPTKNPFNSGLD